MSVKKGDQLNITYLPNLVESENSYLAKSNSYLANGSLIGVSKQPGLVVQPLSGCRLA